VATLLSTVTPFSSGAVPVMLLLMPVTMGAAAKDPIFTGLASNLAKEKGKHSSISQSRPGRLLRISSRQSLSVWCHAIRESALVPGGEPEVLGLR